MDRRWIMGWLTLVLCLTALPLNAGLMSFNVDLSGVDVGTGHTLRLYGTISVDPTLPVSAANTSSSLLFRHNLDTPIVLPSVPNHDYPDPLSMTWNVEAGNLFFTRTGTGMGNIGWVLPSFGIDVILGSGLNPHYLQFSDSFTDSENVELKAASGPDGPNGFLIGTTAVPEPSSAFLLIGPRVVLLLLSRRRA